MKVPLPLPVGAPLRVTLAAADVRQELADIARVAQGLAWQWTSEALARGDDAGANLVARQVPFVAGVHIVGKPELGGLPGVLADSLPDAWGRLLMDRALRKHGVEPRALGGIDRLTLVGASGPGALVFAPAFDWEDVPEAFDLEQLARDSELVLEGREPAHLDALARAGGSAGGSRPKAWVAVDAAGRMRVGAGELGPDETGWLVKFRARLHDPEDIGPIEYAYTKMAAAAGLNVPQPWLIDTARHRYFASRRFDRDGGARVHVLSAAGFLGVHPEQATATDYADLLMLTRRVTRSEVEVHAAYRHAVFNVLAHNRDDHLKQFGFVRRAATWQRSPAFDLTFSDGPGGEHTLLVAGTGQPTRASLEALAERTSIKARPAQKIRDEVSGAVSRWSTFARQAGVSAASRQRIATTLKAIQ
ncbi:MAG: type II toxin-antitoxin system HipA family toxin [Deltaproteobacteria bacterium]|nr:type II toxin-antitoxin system HipA family toxin [Deltaproteobacteria bacterium]